MKGAIAVSLQSMVEKEFGKDKWVNIIKRAGLPANTTFFAHHEIEDKAIMHVVKSTCEELNITLEQAADAFGNYWMTEYAPKKYYAFILTVKDAKSFLLKMNEVHKKITSQENATPPKFEFEEKNDNTITMKYISKRNMEVFWIGLIKGVGNYYKQNIEIKKIETSKVELTFN